MADALKDKYEEELLRLPFDQFSRQKIVKTALERLRKNKETYKILDVGGYKGATKLFYPGDEVTVLDVFDVNEPDYLKGDGTDLPFENGSFDYVLNFDVLEHIPFKKRDSFIEECYRVSKRGAIYAAPHSTPENIKAEAAMNKIYESIMHKKHQWLTEHMENTLPQRELVSKKLNALGASVIEIGSNYLPLWIQMQYSIFLAEKNYEFGEHITEIYKAFNTYVQTDSDEKIENNYRIVLFGIKNINDYRLLLKEKSIAKLEFTEIIDVQSAFAEYNLKSINKVIKNRDRCEATNQQLRKELEYLNNTLCMKIRTRLRKMIKI